MDRHEAGLMASERSAIRVRLADKNSMENGLGVPETRPFAADGVHFFAPLDGPVEREASLFVHQGPRCEFRHLRTVGRARPRLDGEVTNCLFGVAAGPTNRRGISDHREAEMAR